MAPSAPVAPPPAVAQPPIVPPPSVVAASSVERIDTWKLHEQAAARRAPGDAGGDARPAAAPAAAEATSEASAPGPRAVPIETVWLEPPSEIERAARSSTLRAQLGDDDDDDWMTPGEAGGSAEDRARRDVARWLRAAPLPLDRLGETLSRALEKDAAERAYVIVAGELTWSFDAREAIRAWIALGTPLAAEPRVKSAIEAAEASLHEHLVPIPDVLTASLERLKDAVRGVAKLVGSTPIEAAAERYLIEERGFGRRRVWGQSRLRAQLQARGARYALPVYLPESAGWEAPLAQRVPVRLVGELRTRQDPLEPMTVCLRGIAMGVELDARGAAG